MSKIYWGIKGKDGKLITHSITGAPIMRETEEKLLKESILYPGERPVRVTITEVE